MNGGSGGARTRDQCLKRALLYQLSYRPMHVLRKSGSITTASASIPLSSACDSLSSTLAL